MKVHLEKNPVGLNTRLKYVYLAWSCHTEIQLLIETQLVEIQIRCSLYSEATKNIIVWYNTVCQLKQKA